MLQRTALRCCVVAAHVAAALQFVEMRRCSSRCCDVTMLQVVTLQLYGTTARIIATMWRCGTAARVVAALHYDTMALRVAAMWRCEWRCCFFYFFE
jgi:hypothetical protein